MEVTIGGGKIALLLAIFVCGGHGVYQGCPQAITFQGPDTIGSDKLGVFACSIIGDSLQWAVNDQEILFRGSDEVGHVEPGLEWTTNVLAVLVSQSGNWTASMLSYRPNPGFIGDVSVTCGSFTVGFCTMNVPVTTAGGALYGDCPQAITFQGPTTIDSNEFGLFTCSVSGILLRFTVDGQNLHFEGSEERRQIEQATNALAMLVAAELSDNQFGIRTAILAYIPNPGFTGNFIVDCGGELPVGTCTANVTVTAEKPVVAASTTVAQTMTPANASTTEASCPIVIGVLTTGQIAAYVISGVVIVVLVVLSVLLAIIICFIKGIFSKNLSNSATNI